MKRNLRNHKNAEASTQKLIQTLLANDELGFNSDSPADVSDHSDFEAQNSRNITTSKNPVQKELSTEDESSNSSNEDIEEALPIASTKDDSSDSDAMSYQAKKSKKDVKRKAHTSDKSSSGIETQQVQKKRQKSESTQKHSKKRQKRKSLKITSNVAPAKEIGSIVHQKIDEANLNELQSEIINYLTTNLRKKALKKENKGKMIQGMLNRNRASLSWIRGESFDGKMNSDDALFAIFALVSRTKLKTLQLQLIKMNDDITLNKRLFEVINKQAQVDKYNPYLINSYKIENNWTVALQILNSIIRRRLAIEDFKAILSHVTHGRLLQALLDERINDPYNAEHYSAVDTRLRQLPSRQRRDNSTEAQLLFDKFRVLLQTRQDVEFLKLWNDGKNEELNKILRNYIKDPSQYPIFEKFLIFMESIKFDFKTVIKPFVNSIKYPISILKLVKNRTRDHQRQYFKNEWKTLIEDLEQESSMSDSSEEDEPLKITQPSISSDESPKEDTQAQITQSSISDESAEEEESVLSNTLSTILTDESAEEDEVLTISQPAILLDESEEITQPSILAKKREVEEALEQNIHTPNEISEEGTPLVPLAEPNSPNLEVLMSGTIAPSLDQNTAFLTGEEHWDLLASMFAERNLSTSAIDDIDVSLFEKPSVDTSTNKANFFGADALMSKETAIDPQPINEIIDLTEDIEPETQMHTLTQEFMVRPVSSTTQTTSYTRYPDLADMQAFLVGGTQPSMDAVMQQSYWPEQQRQELDGGSNRLAHHIYQPQFSPYIPYSSVPVQPPMQQSYQWPAPPINVPMQQSHQWPASPINVPMQQSHQWPAPPINVPMQQSHQWPATPINVPMQQSYQWPAPPISVPMQQSYQPPAPPISVPMQQSYQPPASQTSSPNTSYYNTWVSLLARKKFGEPQGSNHRHNSKDIGKSNKF